MRFLNVGVGLLLATAVGAEELKIPQEVDLGGAGLSQFRYACPANITCRVQCYSHGTAIPETKEAVEAVVTSYRSHGRQIAPEREIRIVGRNRDDDRVIQISGDNACVFDRMSLTSASGFTTRLKR